MARGEGLGVCWGLPCMQALFQMPSELPSEGAVLPWWWWGQALRGTVSAQGLRWSVLASSDPRACKPHVLLMSWVWGLELHITMHVVIRIMYLVLFSVDEKLLNKTDCKVNRSFVFSLRNPVSGEKLVNVWVLFGNAAPPRRVSFEVTQQRNACARMCCDALSETLPGAAGSGD